MLTAARDRAISLGELLAGIRFLTDLPPLLRRSITTEEARRTITDRLASREANFLYLARRAIYPYPASTYHQLLRVAGCELGDLERMLRLEGLEGALAALYRAGVYVRLTELKGRRPIVRGSVTIPSGTGRLRNPLSRRHASSRTGGTSGDGGTEVGIDLRAVHDLAPNVLLTLAARGGLSWPQAFWMGHGGAALVALIRYTAIGITPRRWFSQIQPDEPTLHPRYRWGARLFWLAGRLAGVRVPLPELAESDGRRVMEWAAEMIRGGQTPHIMTRPSGAALVCQTATNLGIDLRTTEFTVSGEPLTAARREVIEAAGARVVPRYVSNETNVMGEGCLLPGNPDAIHLFTDCWTAIHPDPNLVVDGLRPRSLLITGIRPHNPLLIVNVSLGDEATLETADCGCGLDSIGWTRRLHTIRSYEKLTAEAVSMLDVDVIKILEEVLPARFGGGATDYQLVEQESDGGASIVRLIVNPTVGLLDLRAVADAFLSAVGGGSGTARVAELLWRQSGVLQVERIAPLRTPAGKILHLHRIRSGSAEPMSAARSGTKEQG